MLQASAPRLPPVVARVESSVASVAAVLDSFDDTTNPQFVSVIIGDQLPAQSGFIWNTSIKATIQEAPDPAAAPPSGTIYYNNKNTRKGGTIVYVDTDARTVISVTSNYSTLAAIDYSSLFQFIKHDGAFNVTGGFQNPEPIDLTQLAANPFINTAPALASPSPAIIAYIGAGSGSYDAEITFHTVIANPSWLGEVRLYVVANGSQAATLDDVSHNAIFKAAIAPTADGHYTAWVHGLSAGTPYDVYAAFFDLASNISPGAFLVETDTNPLVLGADSAATMPPGTTPVVISHGAEFALNDGPNLTAFDYIVPSVVLDPNGVGSNNWLAEIELVYRVAGSGSDGSVINSISPQAVDLYEFIYPAVPYGTNPDGSPVVYDLGLRYIDFAGNPSNILYFVQAGGNLQVGSLTLQQIPAGTVFSVTGQTEETLTNTGGSTFYAEMGFNIVITVPPGSSPPGQWLDKIYLLAKEQPTGTSDTDHVPTDYARVGWVPGALVDGASGATSTIAATFGPMGNNAIWQLAIQLCDHSGTTSDALPIYLVGLQNVDPTKTPNNANLLPDSDMNFTTPYAGGAIGSTYWTYAGIDPTRFRVINGSASSKMLAADSHTGAHVGPVCAYSQAIPVTAGVTYCLSAMTDLYAPSGGAQFIGIVNASDKLANNTTPATILQQFSCPVNDHGTPAPSLSSLNWTSTITGNIVVALWATNISGDCSWYQPQFEVGTSPTAYKSGVAVDTSTGTIGHEAQSIAVQQTIDASGGLNVSGADASYGLLPQGVHSQEVQDVVGTSGGRGVLSVSPPGGTTGTLPYGANSGAVTSTIGNNGLNGYDQILPGSTYGPSIKNGGGAGGLNLIQNPNFSIPAITGDGWYVASHWYDIGTSGSLGGAIYQAGLEGGAPGDILIRFMPNVTVPAGANYSVAYATDYINVIPGEVLSGSAVAVVSATASLATLGLTFDSGVYIQWFDTNGTYINTDALTSELPYNSVLTTLNGGCVVPAGAVKARPYIFVYVINPTGADVTCGNFLYADVRYQSVSCKVAPNLTTGGTTGVLPYGQHAGAITGVIDGSGNIPSSGPLNTQYSICGIPDVSVFSVSATSSLITVSWSTLPVYFPNGSIYSIPAGSFTKSTGPSATYIFQVYYNTFTGVMNFVDVSAFAGHPSVAQLVAANADGCIPLTNFFVLGSPASGGGTITFPHPAQNTCPSVNQLIRTKELGYVPAGHIEVGMHLYSTPRGGWVRVLRKQIMDGFVCKIKLGGEEFEVDMNHHMLRHGGDPSPASDDWIPVYELTRNTLLQGVDDVPISVRSIGEEYPGEYVELTVDGNVYDLGTSVVHNIMTAST